jgi:hypothetical protein
MSIKPLLAGAILLNVVTLAASVYLMKPGPQATPLPNKSELTIEPAKIRQLDRKQIPNLAMIASVQRTALEVSAVRVDAGA